MGVSPHDGINALVRRDTGELALSVSLPGKDTAKRRLSSSWEEGPYQNPPMLVPQSQASSLQNCEKKKSLLFKPPLESLGLAQGKTKS